MSWWEDFKKEFERGSVFDMVVNKKVPPGLLFFEISERIQGSLHVSELNWNFGLSQVDFRNIKVRDIIRVYIIGFDDKYKKVLLGRKALLKKPSETSEWHNFQLNQPTDATVFEELRNKVIITFEGQLFGTIPILEVKSFNYGDRIKVFPIRKLTEHNIIECTLPELAGSIEEQSNAIIKNFKETVSQNEFSSSEVFLESYENFSQSLYWIYLSKEERIKFKQLFTETENLFSKVDKGTEIVFFEFDFNHKSVYDDFIKNIAPTLFDKIDQSLNKSEKELLSQLSSLSFWYTQYERVRKTDIEGQTIKETLFILFNDIISIRGNIETEGIFKIWTIKAKSKTESLKEKQNALKRNDIIFLNRPLGFYYSLHSVPNLNFNKSFFQRIENKLDAFKIFEIAKNKSFEILETQGKDFMIFRDFLEVQKDYDIKEANETEIELKDCKLVEDIIHTDEICFDAEVIGEFAIQQDDKISISVRAGKKPFYIKNGTIVSIKNKKVRISCPSFNFDTLRNGCFIKLIVNTLQYSVQLDVLNKFFLNKLPLITFYKIFHDRESLESPEIVDVSFVNPILAIPKNPQGDAVRKATGNKNIFLIQGPPGTGKTTVITEIVKQLIKRGEKILVTSQTHIAVDNVLEKIMDDSSINIARIGHQDTISDFAEDYLIDVAIKKFAEENHEMIDVKIDLLTHYIEGQDISDFSKDSFGKPYSFKLEDIEDFITYIQTCEIEKSLALREILEFWKKVIAKCPLLLTYLFLKNLDVVFGTCIGIATNRFFSESNITFDTVILDEAGKANISETLTAITRAQKIILVGDHKQLPPYLDKEKVTYFKDSFIESGGDISEQEIKRALGSSFFEYLQGGGILKNENKFLLSVQHRMHPDIGNFVSETFYDSEVENGEGTFSKIINLPPPFDKQIIFIDTSSDRGSIETFQKESYYNKVEAEFIVDSIIPELVNNHIDSKSFAIISPYSKQCEKISELLRNSEDGFFKSLEIATLDSFQGRELDIIIFSFTRSSSDKYVGFLDDARRLNVALSRARKKLILIGNAETLVSSNAHYDQYYTRLFKNLLKYAKKYGSVFKINELRSKKLPPDIVVGKNVKGKVKLIKDYGVFVSLGRIDGLIPLHELSWHFGKSPNEIVEISQVIDAKVIKIDEQGRITLSLKQTMPKPNESSSFKEIQKKRFELFAMEFKINDKVKGRIIQIDEKNSKSMQVLVELKYGVRGLFYTFPENIFISKGEEVEILIKRIDNKTLLVLGELNL